jgi:glycosyltransferase involved in cell wall biosynthesis
MSRPSLAVSIITYRRSQLLDLCLKSLQDAMIKQAHPLYIIVQDASKDDMDVLRKYEHLISEIVHTGSDGLHVEELINRNRILAWELPLIQKGYQHVLCLEDDVEVSADIFEFTGKVLEQNSGSRDFWGINYGSFEMPEDSGSYSKLRFGLHGPASLISQTSLKKFQIKTLQRFGGSIPWDGWIEPIVKKGFVVTSNVARYKDNGEGGTHTTAADNSEYFTKLNESFDYGQKRSNAEYRNIDIEHSWRKDSIVYKGNGKTNWYLKYLAVRFYQFAKIFKRNLMGSL